MSFDVKKLRVADYVIAGGAILFLVFAIFPWFDYSYYYFGVKDATFFDDSLSGFGSGLVTSAFVLFLLAALWAMLPAVYHLRVGFARGFVTAGLAALGLVLTLIAWIKSLGGGFFIFALLGFVVAVGITLFALLSLLPELRNRPSLPGALAGAAQWANQQAPDLNTAFGGRPQQAPPGRTGPQGPPPAQPGHPGQPQGQPGQPQGQPGQPQGQPHGAGPYGQPGGPAPSAPLPPPPYGQHGGPTPPGTGPVSGSGSTPSSGATATGAGTPGPGTPAGGPGDGSAAHGADAPHGDGTA
jgi:hypothetical protein